MSDHGITRKIAEFCAAFRYEDLPPAAVEEAKRIILDTIGVGLGGHGVHKGRIGVEVAQLSGGKAESTIIGVAGKVAAGQAAFANGELMNALDWCPLLPPAHVTAYVLPPILALAEARGLSGKEVIKAAVLAMEITGRLSTATGGLRSEAGGLPRRVWGLSSNQIGGVAGLANLLGFDAEKTLHAIGTASYFAPLATHVKFNYSIEQGYSKYAPSGWMAQGSVTTALLAERGYHGDITCLEGPYGFAVQNGASSWAPEKLMQGLGQEWLFMNVGYKPWPTCGVFQSSCNLLHDLILKHDFKPDEITEVEFYCDPIGSLPAYVSTTPSDHVEAASSGPFIVAVIAHRLKRGPGMQAQSVIDDPAIRAFMKKVKMGINPRCEILRKQDIEEDGRPYPRRRPGHVVIHARGQVFEATSDFADWTSIDPDYAPSNQALAGKFRENGEAVLSQAKLNQAIDAILRLDQLDHIFALMEPLAG